jgi:hypothetical protein
MPENEAVDVKGLPRPVTLREVIRMTSGYLRNTDSAKEFVALAYLWTELKGYKRKIGRPLGSGADPETPQDSVAALVEKLESKG